MSQTLPEHPVAPGSYPGNELSAIQTTPTVTKDNDDYRTKLHSRKRKREEGNDYMISLDKIPNHKWTWW